MKHCGQRRAYERGDAIDACAKQVYQKFLRVRLARNNLLLLVRLYTCVAQVLVALVQWIGVRRVLSEGVEREREETFGERAAVRPVQPCALIAHFLDEVLDLWVYAQSVLDTKNELVGRKLLRINQQ